MLKVELVNTDANGPTDRPHAHMVVTLLAALSQTVDLCFHHRFKRTSCAESCPRQTTSGVGSMHARPLPIRAAVTSDGLHYNIGMTGSFLSQIHFIICFLINKWQLPSETGFQQPLHRQTASIFGPPSSIFLRLQAYIQYHHGCRKSAMSLNAPCLISPLHLLEAALFFQPNSYQLCLPLPSHQCCLLQLRITEQCGLLHNPFFFKGGNVLEGGVRRGVRGQVACHASG